ncbi:kinase-like protein [Calocera viscosa TUFC12733]|uniref:Kinase-like protein n=1 Tax=Calocera viscosa (strain TUFC12733) TaxID=1330018 RepID=A0A167L8C8_CALVF|nr:kinase-like protein [Calocera viscosa TUFC12733]
MPRRGRLGTGSMGDVWAVKLHYEGSMFDAALKESRVCGHVVNTNLKHEALILQALQHNRHIPRLYAYGRQKHFEYIAMEQCGPSLAQDKSRIMPVSEVFELALQLLDALEAIHHVGILHADVTPGNILLCPAKLGVPQRFVICDFSLSRSLATSARGGVNHLIGSMHWASVRSHQHQALGPGHDLEGLAYILLYVLKGWLPWKPIDDASVGELFTSEWATSGKPLQSIREKIGRTKEAWSGEMLSSGLPPVFGDLLDYARRLGPNDVPAYDMLRQRFQHDRTESQIEEDNPPTSGFPWGSKNITQDDPFITWEQIEVPSDSLTHFRLGNDWWQGELPAEIDLPNAFNYVLDSAWNLHVDVSWAA